MRVVDMLCDIDVATAPGKMSPEEALEFLRALTEGIEDRMVGLRDDIALAKKGKRK